MTGRVAANEALAFLLELAALAALAYAGYATGGVPLAIVAPAVATVLWGLFAAPRARYRIPLPGQLAVKAVVFGTAVVGLSATGHPVLAVVFAVVVVLNTAALTVWRVRSGR